MAVFATCAGAGVWASGALADDGACDGTGREATCVMLIQIDGLEPKDVTPQTTPFLWAMAHPDADPSSGAGNTAAQYPGSAAYAGMLNQGQPRKGFTWQAARGVMQASTAANTAALLTGGYADQTGIPADAYVGKSIDSQTGVVGGNVDKRLGAVDDNTDISGSDQASGFQTIFEMVNDKNERRSAAFIGDPALKDLTLGSLAGDTDLRWSPEPYVTDPAGTPDPPSPNQAPPLFCPVPRDVGQPGNPSETDAAQVGCVAPDAQVLHNQGTGAFAQLEASVSNFPTFTYIELAELGAVKRATGDVETTQVVNANPNAGDLDTPTSIPEARTEMDAALATFFGKFQDPTKTATMGAKFNNMFVFVVGDHGYELTPLDKRVPDPDADPTAGSDLSSYVSAFRSASSPTTTFKLVPQGTLASVSCDQNCPASAADPSAAYKAALAELKGTLAPDGLVDDACKALPSNPPNTTNTTGCIQDVLYTRPQLIPSAADAGQALSAKHPCSHPPVIENEDFAGEGGIVTLPLPACSGWRLDHNKFQGDQQIVSPSGIGGDLVISLKPGWAAGKAVPNAQDLTGQGDSLTNPYLGSSGGPRNRPIAAIVNGPEVPGNNDDGGVRQVLTTPLNGGRYPVMATDPLENDGDAVSELEPHCEATTPRNNLNPDPKFPANPTNPFEDVSRANSDTDTVTPKGLHAAESLNDADAPGYLCQAEIVDFAPTIASVLGLSMESRQLSGRLLREAFERQLPAACGECGIKVPDTFIVVGPISQPGQPAEIASYSATFEFDSDPPPPKVKYWCRVDSSGPVPVLAKPADLLPAPWFRCGTKATEISGRRSHTLGSLAIGMHTFDVTAQSEKGPDRTPEHAEFRVIPFFDFHGLLRKVGAFVTDKKGRPVKRSALLVDRKGRTEEVRGAARRRAMLDHLDVRADFGRPFSKVTLSLYRKFRKPAGGCPGGKGKCQLDTLAKFAPFTIARGPVDLLFAVPKHFSGIRLPTHTGISVQELCLVDPDTGRCIDPDDPDRPMTSRQANLFSACQSKPNRTIGPKTHLRPYCVFRPIGRTVGALVPIASATRLHRRNR